MRMPRVKLARLLFGKQTNGVVSMQSCDCYCCGGEVSPETPSKRCQTFEKTTVIEMRRLLDIEFELVGV